MQMIEEDEEPAFVEEFSSPFEGPEEGFTFIGTKPIYLFIRFLLTIYQRFLKAKEFSEQRSSSTLGNDSESQQSPDLYKLFLTLLIFKIRDKNKSSFEECLRKIFC